MQPSNAAQDQLRTEHRKSLKSLKAPDRRPDDTSTHTGRALRSCLRVGAVSSCGLLGGVLVALAQPADLELVQVATGFTRPVGARHAGDGSGRVFVFEQGGVIQVVQSNGTVLPTPFLDLSAVVDDANNEQGLLGMAFDPDYANNGLFYVSYTADPGPGSDLSTIARYEVSAGDANVADAGSAFVLFEAPQVQGNHNGGNLLFGPDGYLYLSLGDGGVQFDGSNNAQPYNELLGKILRIDVNGSIGVDDSPCGVTTNYGIPDDNPFQGIEGGDPVDDNLCDEIWSNGFRNPWRFSFDRFTGDLFIGDVGQGTIEEVSFEAAGSTGPGAVPGGHNYGWACFEGTVEQNYQPCLDYPGTAVTTLVPPILEYNRVGTGDCTVVGGYRYRGTAIPGLRGLYLYADYCSGRIWIGTETSPGVWSSTLWDDRSFRISSFGEDEAGELYVLDIAIGNAGGGVLYRFESMSSVFGDGFESGNTSSWAASVP